MMTQAKTAHAPTLTTMRTTMKAARAAYGSSLRSKWEREMIASAGQAGQLHGPYQLKIVHGSIASSPLFH